ncbi:MAG: anti-sigma factor [Microbacterium gubbeenense]|uniref:anti-sigma factor n=1 Tax=Microbacterium gubbeenense TaxID=159896 RepID=UPI0003FCF2C9|nr:anti-sigma factor [Microbacterium gubbeenense]
MNEHEFAELAAGHALHALSAEDEARYLEALRAHPEWEPIADEDADTVGGLADAAAPALPSAGVRDALLAQIASMPQLPADTTESSGQDAPVPPQASEHRARPKRLRIMFALAAGIALVAGIGFGSMALNDYLARPASVVALDEIEAAADAAQASAPVGDGTATVHWSAELGEAVLVADGLEPLESDRTYQLWFVRGETALPAGIFEPESGEAVALLDGEMLPGDVVAVTVEPEGGSPTGLPTSEPIFAIPTA